MKRTTIWILFLLLVFFVIQFRFQIGIFSFLIMLLAVIAGVLAGGLRMGVLMLGGSILAIAYFFLTPRNLLLITSSEIQQLILFLIEGLVVVFLIHILKTSREEEHGLRERFQVILSSIGEGVIATDKNGKITYMNAYSQMMTGWRFSNAKTKHISDILRCKEKEKKEELSTSLRQVLIEGKTTSFQTLPLQTRQKREMMLQYTLAPLRSTEGRTIGIVLIFRDVSEHKDMEIQREVLLGSISHELKNQLTSIQGYAYILQKKLSETDNTDHISLTEKLNNKLSVMTEMISSMLDLSKIKMGKLDMKTVDFSLEELTSVIVNDQKVSSNYDITIETSLSQYVKGDKIRIGQVLTNLISNAVKYSPHNKKIIVTIEQQEHDAMVSVKDFGNGIPIDQLDKIFQPFYRAANTEDRASIPGSGLGLYISQAIVRQNGGEIWAHSVEGEGSTFCFTLPLSDKPESIEVQDSPQGVMDRIRDLLKLQSAT